MTKLKALAAAALAVGALAVAAPAQAQNVNASCSTEGHLFTGAAFFQTVGSTHSWTRWQYVLQNTGEDSNVNIRLREAGTVVYSHNSPDNREPGVLYTHRPPFPISTLRVNTEITAFTAIFDEPFSGDPSCTASTNDPG